MNQVEKEIYRLEKLRAETARDMAEKKRMEKMAQEGQSFNRRKSDTQNNWRKFLQRKNKFNPEDDLKYSTKLLRQPWRIMEQVGKKPEDALYLMAFFVSIILDISTFLSGTLETGVAVIPLVGEVAASAVATAMLPIIFGGACIIGLIYIFAGHYKKRKIIVKVATLLGFTFLELLPIASTLPGFVGQFIINYFVIALPLRAMEEIKKEELQKKIKATQLVKERMRRQQLMAQKAQQQFAQI